MISVKAKYNETKEITEIHKMVIEALFEGKNSNHVSDVIFAADLFS